jgi:hypothetical protein
VPSHQSRTKDNVDHAGPSPLPESLKVSSAQPKVPSQTLLNNNSLIVLVLCTVTSDVTVVCHQEPLTTLRGMVLQPKTNMPTRPSREVSVSFKEVPGKLLAKLPFLLMMQV